ncbi:unnamed protein product [Cyclocybe aegerita]|uniref:Major facilitator superfamily (MFS) profile domain-containing protein n=1 Tax=Cyclocybe aegerita TaxID=1973307 RepID=A0A8S0XMA7_CYCAE|nr:unnamed protein product [Cyclocybe aegerita]
MYSNSTPNEDGGSVPQDTAKTVKLPPESDVIEYGPNTDLFFLPIPSRLRYRSDKPFKFGIWTNCGLSIAAAFLICNLNYCVPLLIQMAISFDVSHKEISSVPTLHRAGYSVGVFFLCPLGDLVRRRQLILLLITITAALIIGFATTHNYLLFEVLAFLMGLTNVSPQILVPLAADLAPPTRRSFTYSLIQAGMSSNTLMTGVLAGVIGELASWRVVYYMAVGVQCAVLLLCYLIVPDCPKKSPDMTYWGILWSMIKYGATEPVMVQLELMAVATSAAYYSFTVTLTFLLGGEPYHFSTLVIGLFGLTSLGGAVLSPLAGRLIDRISPWYGTLMATLFLIAFQAVHTAAGGFSLAVLIISCLVLGAARQIENISMTMSMFMVDMNANSRLNALLTNIGLVIGTSVGTKVFVESSWRACAVLSLALYSFQIVVLLLRGPHCQRRTWFGYDGGFGFLKEIQQEAEGKVNQKA